LRVSRRWRSTALCVARRSAVLARRLGLRLSWACCCSWVCCCCGVVLLLLLFWFWFWLLLLLLLLLLVVVLLFKAWSAFMVGDTGVRGTPLVVVLVVLVLVESASADLGSSDVGEEADAEEGALGSGSVMMAILWFSGYEYGIGAQRRVVSDSGERGLGGDDDDDDDEGGTRLLSGGPYVRRCVCVGVWVGLLFVREQGSSEASFLGWGSSLGGW
jgi:hypothetical protein